MQQDTANLATTETPAPAPRALATVDDSSRAIGAFSSEKNFMAAQRMAKALAASSLVPEAYRSNLPNTLIAMELASRIGVSVFAAMQNLDIIHGRPSWRAQFLIATVNGSGRFSPLRFRFEGKQGSDSWGCRAHARDNGSGEDCVGPLITIGLAKAEGWYQRSGSKWKTLPELMLHYRAAAFWTRIYAPELSLGMQTAEEIVDTTGVVVPTDASPPAATGSAAALEADLLAEPESAPEPATADPAMREPGEEG